MNTKHAIGQVLYVILAKEARVFPVQVVEELVSRTMNGESITYKVQAGRELKLILLSNIAGEVFDSVEAVRKAMITRATDSVNRLVSNAVQSSIEWYGQVPAQASQASSALPTSALEDVAKKNEDEELITLPDGRKARPRFVTPDVLG